MAGGPKLASSAPSPALAPVPQPEPIPDFIRQTLNLQEEKEPRLVELAKRERAILICAIAPYTSMRVSPIQELSASIGLHEEFAFEALIDEISSRGMTNLKVIFLLNSPGGGLHSSFKVARALRNTFQEIEVYVPHMAASGGTLIALVGSKIVMGLMSQLSPLDPQIGYKGRQISALTGRHAYNRVCKMFEKLRRDEAPYPQQRLAELMDPYLMEDWHAAVETAEQYATQILTLSQYPNPEDLAHSLIHHFSDHDSDINYDTAKTLGIRVEKHDASDRNKAIWRLFRAWLGNFLFQESGTHVLRYVLPMLDEENGANHAQPA